MAGTNNNFRLAPGEEYVHCPYNESHMITNATILKHLQKCRTNYIKTKGGKEKSDIVSCSFNWAHQMPKVEIDFHQRTCADQFNIVPHLQYHQSSEFQAKAAAQLAANQESSSRSRDRREATTTDNSWEEADEDWEEESKGYGPGYDPKVKLEQGPVIPIVPQGMTKSERKQFRAKERQRQEEYLIKQISAKSAKKECKRYAGEDEPYAASGSDPYFGEDPYPS